MGLTPAATLNRPALAWAAVLTLSMAALLLLVSPSPLAGETTQTWEQSTLEDFENGRAERISIRSDGKLMLAPRFREIHEAPSSYLWALAADSRGNLYTGGGPGATVHRITPEGEAGVFFEASAVEIHALAVDGDDNVYAATSPDASVYKIDPEGNASLFFNPGVNYIWGMVFDAQGNLFVATGDQGRVYRVTPEGEGSVYFDTEETHVRSVLLDANGDLIIGTDPSGLILRVAAAEGGAPRGFVLYQSSKKEITALALGPDQSIYAAGAGTRTAPAPAAGSAPPPPAQVQVNTAMLPGVPQPPENQQEASQQQARQPQTPPPSAFATRITGGSEIYQIAPGGDPTVIWDSPRDIVYALALDQQGRLLAGTGDRGRLFRIESRTLHTLLASASSSQITAIVNTPGGKVFAATSNIAKIYELGSDLETEGTFESEVFDADIFSQWGRLEWRGGAPGSSRIAVATRSGNLNSPHRNWSPWSSPIESPAGQDSESPQARFVQWKATLSANEGPDSPVLDAVRLYYLPRNVAPLITAMEATPPNHEFIRPNSNAAPRNVTLPPLGGSRQRRRGVTVTTRQVQAMRPAKGMVGVRWQADDENGDDLSYRVEIRGENEQNWILLEEEVSDEFLDWDSTSFADGLYEVRVTASDAPSNPASEAKSDSRISEPFVIDNTAPAVNSLEAAPEQGRLRVRFSAVDTATKITSAEYSIDGGDWTPVLPSSRLFDSKEASFDFLTADVTAGEHTVAVRVYDEYDNLATSKTVVR